MGRKKSYGRFDKKKALIFDLVPTRTVYDGCEVDLSEKPRYVLEPKNVRTKEDFARLQKWATDKDFLHPDWVERTEEEHQEYLKKEKARLKREAKYHFTNTKLMPAEYNYEKHLRTIYGDGVFMWNKTLTEEEKLVHLRRSKQMVEEEKKSGKLKYNLDEIEPGGMDIAKPDFFAALDHAEEFEELPDNFMELAMGDELPDDWEADGYNNLPQNDDVEESEEEVLKCDDSMEEEEEEVHGTKPLTDLDEMFDLMKEAYEDDWVGEREDAVTEGKTKAEHMKALLKFANRKFCPYTPEELEAWEKEAKEKRIQLIRSMPDDNRTPEEVDRDLKEYFKKPERDQWDCESILSTRTNHENHPAIIEVKKKKKPKRIILNKMGVPIGVLTGRTVEKNDLAVIKEGQEESEVEDDSEQEGSPEDKPVEVVRPEPGTNRGERRPKNESQEEKRVRKAQMKALRKANRIRKKLLKQRFMKVEKKAVKLETTSAAAHSSAFRMR